MHTSSGVEWYQVCVVSIPDVLSFDFGGSTSTAVSILNDLTRKVLCHNLPEYTTMGMPKLIFPSYD